MRTLFLSLLGLLYLLPAGTQVSVATLEFKYDLYKERFWKDFILIDWGGDGIGEYEANTMTYEKAGYSIPASGIFPVDNPWTYWEYSNKHCKANKNIDGHYKDIIKWGDGTFHLGYYIAVLATEYELYRRQGLATAAQKSLEELYLALQAYRRVDMTANQVAINWHLEHKPNCDPQVDLSGHSGFFFRDDVVSTLHKDFNKGGLVSSLGCMESLLEFDTDKGGGRMVSQDQICGMLFGLSFVTKFIPDEILIIGEKQINLREMSREMAYGMVKYVHQRLFRGIHFPKYIKGKVQLGADAFAFAFGMRRALDFIYPGHDIRSTWFDRFAWEVLGEDIGVNLFQFLKLAKNDNIRMYLEYGVSGDMESFKDIQRACLKASQKEVFIFAKALVHDYPADKIKIELKKTIEDLLMIAPDSGTGRPKKERVPQWVYDNRWRTYANKPDSRAYSNGLDYMLAHNLYMLLYEVTEVMAGDIPD